MSFLYGATIAVNLLALVLAIWLGLFLVSRSPKYLVAWLTALTLWFMAAMFLGVLLAINPPPVVTLKFTWVRLFFPYWPMETLAGDSNNWLQGWSVAPALAVWHHVTILLLPGKISPWRSLRIILGYLVAVIGVIVQTNSPILFTGESDNPLFLNSLHPGPWYPIFAVALVALTWTCVVNLVVASRNATTSIARKQLQVLAWASLMAGLAGFVSIAASYFMVPIPILVISLLEAIPVFLIGYSVARYSALMEGRTIQKDFLYNLFLLGLVLLIYIPISWIIIDVYHLPMVVLAVFPTLAVVTHSSIAAVYWLMDRFFYQQETRQLRLQLRQLWRTVGVEGTLETLLGPSLETLCNSVDASYGLILVFEKDTSRKVTASHLSAEIPEFDLHSLKADDAISLHPSQLPTPLDEASLLVPLYGEADQVGALVLGRPENGLHYAPEDMEQILEFTDELGETIQASHRNSQYMAQIAELAQARNAPVSRNPTPVSTESLELILRNLYDYTYLADSPLAEMKLVQSRLSQAEVTHLERGKKVHAVLLDGLEKLHPSTEMRSGPPPREWYPFLILQEAYLNETSNREIMLKLYISEGTFNRTRRMAIRSLARALGEMEASIS